MLATLEIWLTYLLSHTAVLVQHQEGYNLNLFRQRWTYKVFFSLHSPWAPMSETACQDHVHDSWKPWRATCTGPFRSISQSWCFSVANALAALSIECWEHRGSQYLIKHRENTILPWGHGANYPHTETHTPLKICVQLGWQATYKRWLRAICDASAHGQSPLISSSLMQRLCLEKSKTPAS